MKGSLLITALGALLTSLLLTFPDSSSVFGTADHRRSSPRPRASASTGSLALVGTLALPANSRSLFHRVALAASHNRVPLFEGLPFLSGRMKIQLAILFSVFGLALLIHGPPRGFGQPPEVAPR